MRIKVQLSQSSLPFGCDRPLEFRPIVSESSPSSLVEGESKTFGNIQISLKSLGNKQYRIEWYSKMTGATTSIAKIGTDSYSVFRRWAQTKRLPEVSQSFGKRKAALVHFLNNVDIIRATDNIMNDAKNYCLKLFSKEEALSIPNDHRFVRYRLQGAIGRDVQVRAKKDSDRIVAEGILLQLIGNQAEIQVTKFHDLISKKQVQKFNTNLVFM